MTTRRRAANTCPSPPAMTKKQRKLITDHLGFARGHVVQLLNRGVLFEARPLFCRDDLDQLAFLILRRASSEYDPARGASFKTFLRSRLETRLVTMVRDGTHWRSVSTGDRCPWLSDDGRCLIDGHRPGRCQGVEPGSRTCTHAVDRLRVQRLTVGDPTDARATIPRAIASPDSGQEPADARHDVPVLLAGLTSAERHVAELHGMYRVPLRLCLLGLSESRASQLWANARRKIRLAVAEEVGGKRPRTTRKRRDK